MPPRNQLAASISTDTRLTSKTTTMKQDMNNTLERMLNHEELTREETKAILIGITRSEYPPEQITALLTGLQMRGVTVDELLGFRDGILETGVPVPLDCERYVDVVGTGGDRKNTFNISTTACFVIAGAGYKVAKHGNYSATSTSGASNVMARHGIKFTDDIGKLNRSLSECGIVYLHAQLFARAMKFVGPIRKSLSFPTCFNLLGPIVNPAKPQCQLLGVATLDQMRLYNNVYRKIGIDYAIVNSTDGYDEISLTSDFKVATNSYERVFSPEDIGLHHARPEELVAGATEEEAAQIFDSVLNNISLPAQKEIVVANAAFGIQVLERGSKGIDECIAIARESLDSGRALKTFRRFVELNS
jgi:anthranilate phosphoribosyltransferase